MLIRMAIVDLDKEYISRIANVLETYDDVSLFVYTNKDIFEADLKRKKFDILLFAPEFLESLVLVDSSTVTVVFLDDEHPVSEAFHNIAKVRRYQRISMMFQQILEFYAEVCKETPEGVLGQNGVALIAVYSPAGGVGKTTAALVTAVKLAENGYRTLYLNMEDTAAEDYYLPQNGAKGLSDILNILGSNVNFSLKVQSLLQSKLENFYYFNHFTSPGDLEEMTAEEMTELLRALEYSGLFDSIIIDMGVAMPHKLIDLFEMVHKIVLVEKPDMVAARKIERFLSQAHIMNEYGSKMSRLLNFEAGREVKSDSKIPRIGSLPLIPNPDPEQLITILAENLGTQFIEHLVLRR